MTDPAFSLLRIAAFGLPAAVAYGWLTREWLGTWGMLALALGPGYAGLLMYTEVVRRHEYEPEPLRDAFVRFAGLPRPDPKVDEPLEAEDLAVIPSPSIWPFMLSLGLAVLLTGLIFGAWLVVLGGIVTAWALWGWITAVNRETTAAERARAAGAAGSAPPAH
jgi:hypothetical protein